MREHLRCRPRRCGDRGVVGDTSTPSSSTPRERRSSTRARKRCPAPIINFSTPCRQKRQSRGTTCGMTRSRSESRWRNWRPPGHACSTSRSVRLTTGRTTGDTIAFSRRTRALMPISRSCGTGSHSQPQYKGRTHLLITTDHGRGRTAKDWRDHGAKVEGAQDVWMAFASPAMARRGEWKAHAPLSTSQVAATLASWVGLDWNQMRPHAGRPIR